MKSEDPTHTKRGSSMDADRCAGSRPLRLHPVHTAGVRVKNLTLVLILACAGLAGCREGDGPIRPTDGGRAWVVSDPPGARIFVDNIDTRQFTPDTVRGLSGRHDISVRLDTLGTTYGFTARVFLADADSTITISGPLVMRCAEVICFTGQHRYWSANRVRFATNPVGNLFLRAGTGGGGLLWPSVTNNSYVSGGMIAFAGLLGGRDTVSIGIYDNGYLAGRPAPATTQAADRVEVSQTAWIVPPSSLIQRITVRGIEISEQLLATAEVDDIVVLRLVFRNITHEQLYAALDPTVPPGGVAYEQAWVGFMLDPDVGAPGDDALSYESDLDLVFAYDVRWDENTFGGGFARAPGLIGLRMLEAPPDVTIMLNGWTSQGAGSQDWVAGQVNERNGWNMLSGLRPFSPDHPDRRIGHMPLGPGDVRISVSAGPLRLAPRDSAVVKVAIILADPVAGSFNSGTQMEPGEPTDRTRSLYGAAGNLFTKAMEAGAVR